MERQSISERFAALRARNKWSLREVAERSGLSIGYLHALEHGTRFPKLGTRARLAKAFDLSLPELMQGVELPDTETSGAPQPEDISQFPDLAEFVAFMLQTRKENPRIARLVMRIGREVIEDEGRQGVGEVEGAPGGFDQDGG
jgi:transcriptional regulator with XRE-family HTH domain